MYTQLFTLIQLYLPITYIIIIMIYDHELQSLNISIRNALWNKRYRCNFSQSSIINLGKRNGLQQRNGQNVNCF